MIIKSFLRYTWCILSLLLPSLCLGQNTFFERFNTNYEDRIFEAIQTTEGSYILVGKRSTDVNETDVKGLLMLIDSNGTVLKDFVDTNMGQTYFYTIDNVPGTEDTFIVIGNKDTLIGNTWETCLMHYMIDKSLSVLSKHYTHNQSDHLIKPWKTSLVNDSTMMILSGSYDMSYTFPPLQTIVTEIKLPADSIRSFLSNVEVTCIPQDILYIPNSNETHLIYYGGSQTETSDIKILRLDSMLNGIETMESPSYMYSTACATGITDSTYLLTGTAYPVSGISSTRAISTYEMNKFGSGISGIEYYNHPDTMLYGGFGTNTTILNNSIFITGLYNIDPFEIPWQDTPTWVQVTKLDMNLNIENHHFYGGDALYVPYCIIPTIDDGIFITGYTWDFKGGEMQHDIFALKLNSDGLIVDVPENATWQATEAILFPNPARDHINIEFSQVYQTASFQLMDIGGKLILDKQLYSNYQRVNVSGIPAGTYVYRIFNKEGLDERGKVVVK